MASKRVSGISEALAQGGPSGRFWGDHSMLDRTRLDRFIMISFILHVTIFVLQGLIPVKPSIPSAPPPIKVKFIEPEKPKSTLKQGTIIDAPKPEKVEKPDTSELLASYDSRAHSDQKKTPEKKYRRHKTVVPRAAGNPRADKNSMIPPKKKAANPKPRQAEEQSPFAFPLSEKGTFKPQAKEKESAETQSQSSSGTKGSLSLLDGFDPDKYASLDTNTQKLDESDDEETVSLDTTETKYASYFARIKHQIEVVWTYPVDAAQRGISGQLTLRFRISKDGNLLGVQIVEKSGYEILDIAAIKAVKEAAPFYPFPLNIRKDKLSILATFIYSPTYGLLRK